jgi:hypothetical protein
MGTGGEASVGRGLASLPMNGFELAATASSLENLALRHQVAV